MNKHELHSRKCLWCTNPISGRADKKFCNSSCKAHYSRSIVPEPTGVSGKTELLSYQTVSIPADGYLFNLCADEEGETWRTILAQARKHQSAHDSFHQKYANIIEEFLRTEDWEHPLDTIDRSIQEAFTTIEQYLNHPGLRIRGHIAHRRLFSLYLVHDYLEELREGLIEILEQRPQSEESILHPVGIFLSIPERHRRNLVTDLLRVAQQFSS